MDSSRHLAAILFTDIVGYTSMMQHSEMHAVSVFKHYNAVLDKVLADYHGDLLNNYGDGSLCSFHSASEAMLCAIDLQHQLQSEPIVPLRTGLHVGEIFFEDGKVLGDGVNVASRIESLGQANTILFSHEIHDKIKNLPEFRSVSLGSFEFKNVEKPIEVFALTNEGLAIPRKEQMEGKLKENKTTKRHKIAIRVAIGLVGIFLAAAGILLFTNLNRPKFSGKEKSIAVLPFENLSGDKNNEYLSDGITEEITTQLSKIADLRVKARTSSKSYKGTVKNINQIAQELAVAAILQGSVQRSGNQLRISAQLIDASTEEHIWADTYDRNADQIFAIQSEVAQKIAHQLNVRLSVDEKIRIEKKPTNNISAYDDYLKGRQRLWDVLSPRRYGIINEAKKNFQDALGKDSTFGLAWAGLARCNFVLSRYSDVSYRYYHLNNAMENALKGINYAPEQSETHMGLGDVFKYVTLNPALSIHSLQRAIELDPNNAEAYSLLAHTFLEIGRFKEADSNLKKARLLDPQSQLLQSAWLEYYKSSGNIKGLEGFTKEFNVSPSEIDKQDIKIWIFFLRNQYDSLLDYSRNYTLPLWMGIAYAKLGQVKNAMNIIDTLKTQSESNNAVYIGFIYAELNKKGKAMDYMERAYDLRHPALIDIKVNKLYDPLRAERRFKELLARMGVE